MTAKATLGFIGLGVMGEPMCRHLVQKSGAGVIVHDINAEPVARLVGLGCLLATILATYVLSQAVFRAYGLPTNTIEQLLFLEHDPRVVAALRESFRRWTIGSYTVWVRRP